jgi:hypothetical protein
MAGSREYLTIYLACLVLFVGCIDSRIKHMCDCIQHYINLMDDSLIHVPRTSLS